MHINVPLHIRIYRTFFLTFGLFIFLCRVFIALFIDTQRSFSFKASRALLLFFDLNKMLPLLHCFLISKLVPMQVPLT